MKTNKKLSYSFDGENYNGNFDTTIEKMEDKGFRYEELEEGREYVEM